MKILQRTLVFSAFLLSAQLVSAQGDLGDLLKGSAKDANYLAQGYVAPFLKAMGTGLNQGWYNTAKPHKIVGVDLTISVSPVFIPNSDLTYEVDNTKLTNIKLETTHTGTAVSPTGKGQVPTLFGSDKTPTYRLYTSTPIVGPVPDPNGKVTGPPGLALKEKYHLQALPVPIANLGIGLPKNTDLKLRFIPAIDLGGQGKLSMFGVGVMHDVKQWIPGLKNLPFDLSGFVGFTKLKLETGLDKAHPDQKALFDVTGTTIQGLISKKIAVLTVYGGLGYNLAKSTLKVNGNFDLNNDGTTDVKDPVSVAGTANGARVTAGLRLKLAVFTFHGDYTIQKYKTLTVGFGIAVR
jgi:hypothetical protein